MADLSQRALALVKSLSGDTCKFILGTGESPFVGGQRVVFALETSSTKRFAVRAERRISNATGYRVEWEIKLLKEIEEAQIPRLPVLAGFELEPTPPLIATNWVDGDELKWSDSVPSLDIRKHIIQTIAELTLDMLNIQKPGVPALGWITDKITRTRVERARNGTLPGISLTDAEALRLRISEFHLPSFDDAPHVLVHGDLKPSNIIMQKGKLESVIDLGFATLIPLQFATMYPTFLTNEPREVGGTFDWSQCSYSERQAEDRHYFLQCIKELAPMKGECARIYSQILSDDNQEERHWWLSAAFHADMMRALKERPFN